MNLPSPTLSAAIAVLALQGALVLSATPVTGQADSHLERAHRVLSSTPLIDGHNDLPWAIRGSDVAPRDVYAVAHDLLAETPFHTNIPRLREGRVGAQYWSVYIPYGAVEDGAAKTQLEQIDIALQIIDKYPDAFELALDASDVERIFGSGKIASLLGMEGGHAIENSLGALRAFHRAGVRYMTLTHNGTTDWADSAADTARHDGLTAFGREVVREMNRLGMLVDLSHTSPATMNDALDASVAPVIWSHASANGVHEHTRNVPDEVLQRLPENGGVVMVTFVPSFVSPGDEATLADVADHIDHIANVAGVDHVGIGSDFDGISNTPTGLEDPSTFPDLFAELSRRGWTDGQLAKLAGENLLRVMREAEEVARRAQRDRTPSVLTIEQLDGGSDGG